MTVLKYISDGLTSFSKGMEELVNAVILLPVYLIGIGAVSLLSRIVGKKFFETKIELNKKSYWEDVKLNFNDDKEYYRQF